MHYYISAESNKENVVLSTHHTKPSSTFSSRATISQPPPPPPPPPLPLRQRVDSKTSDISDGSITNVNTEVIISYNL